MTKAIFLSASVPDTRAPNFIAEADAIAVTSAVKALVYVILGRRQLVWGGHPAITPMIWSVAASMGVDYGAWVTLYQSKHFQDQYPQDNEKFQNVVYTDQVDMPVASTEVERRNASLTLMRQEMFSRHDFELAIFIGGMSGIIEEFDLFGEFNPKALRVPVLSTGGATGRLTEQYKFDEDYVRRLNSDVDYIPLFHDLCAITSNEPRLERPSV